MRILKYKHTYPNNEIYAKVVCFCVAVYEPYMEQTIKGMRSMVATVQPVLSAKFISSSQTVSIKWHGGLREFEKCIGS